MALSKILLHQKMAKEESKSQFFSRKNIRKMEKTNFGTSGTIIAKIDFFGQVSDADPTSPSPHRPTVTSLI